MLKIYGSMLCPDCVECIKTLNAAEVEYQYLDFSDDLRNLKEFLALRDRDPVFDAIRGSGGIGIPAIVCPDGRILLDWEEVTNK